MRFPLKSGVRGSAAFDEHRSNRFMLERYWDESRPLIGWAMTNPSDADGERDDPTLRKIQQYSRRWNYGGLIAVNVFPWCTHDPNQLKYRSESEDTIIRNEQSLLLALDICSILVCAWGRYGRVDGRSDRVRHLLATRPDSAYKLVALKILLSGEPGHPLYLGMAVKPKPYRI